MKRKTLSGPTWHNLQPYRIKITLVELHTPGLGAWSVYEYEVWEGREFVAKGSYTYGDRFIIVADVLDQLEYELIDKHEVVPCEETFDATYGL